MRLVLVGGLKTREETSSGIFRGAMWTNERLTFRNRLGPFILFLTFVSITVALLTRGIKIMHAVDEYIISFFRKINGASFK